MLGVWPSQVENLLAFFKKLGDCQYVWGLGGEQEELETRSQSQWWLGTNQ